MTCVYVCVMLTLVNDVSIDYKNNQVLTLLFKLKQLWAEPKLVISTKEKETRKREKEN